MANDISLETFQNNTKKTTVIMYVMIGIILIALGATFAGTGTTPALIGGVLAIIGGGYMGYTGYEILVNPRYERKCDDTYFNVYKNLKIPATYLSGDAEIDSELDVTKDSAVAKVQFGSYGGVFLKSNNAGTSIGGNYDAFYIPGNIKTVLSSTTTTSANNADFVYVIKASKDKDRAISLKTDDQVVANRSPIPAISSPAPSDTACYKPDA